MKSIIEAECAAATQEDQGISVISLLTILAKHKRAILLFTFGCGVIAAIVSLLLPARYTATTVILPPQNQSAGSSVMAQLSSMGPMASLAGGLGIKNPNDMYVAFLKSRTVEDAMVDRFHLKDEYNSKLPSDARKAFEDLCDIQSSAKDGLIRISVVDKDPRRAAELANGYIEVYRAFSGKLAVTEASQRRLFFETQLEQQKDKLAAAEDDLKNTQQRTGMIQLDSQARALIESAASLRAQIAAKEVEIHAMQQFASDQNPDMVLAEQQLSGWKAELARLVGNQNGMGDDLLISKGQVPQAALEYARKVRDVKYAETIFELLGRQYEMAKLDEARQGSVIQVVDMAVPPDRRTSPKRALIVLATMVVAFFFVCFCVFLAEGMRRLRRDQNKWSQIKEFYTACKLRA